MCGGAIFQGAGGFQGVEEGEGSHCSWGTA
jgi:hypothetical protein